MQIRPDIQINDFLCSIPHTGYVRNATVQIPDLSYGHWIAILALKEYGTVKDAQIRFLLKVGLGEQTKLLTHEKRIWNRKRELKVSGLTKLHRCLGAE